MSKLLKYSIISAITLPLLAAIVAVFGILYIYLYYGYNLPDHKVLRQYEPQAVTRVHAADGQLLAEYASQNRSFIAVQEVPKQVINAFIAAEDKNFYTHPGVDGVALIRAIIQNINKAMQGERLIGASTITQQVAKNFLVGNAVSYERKIREALLSFRIENILSKEQILELYLNEIYLGVGSYGIAAAALNYFNKSLQELQLHEVAYLAALPKGPGNYHPKHRTSAAIGRRNWVLNRMYAEGYISRSDLIEAKSQELVTYERDYPDLVSAAYFLEETRKEAATAFGADVVNQGGLSVRTTLDTNLQNILVTSLRQGLIDYDQRHPYRRPITSIAKEQHASLGKDWQEILRKIISANEGFKANNPYFWDAAIVLEMTDEVATLGIVSVGKNTLNSGGKAYAGTLELQNVVWEKYILPNGKANKITSLKNIIQTGDVIFVEKTEDIIALRQIPELQGAGVILDPHNGRIFAMTGGWDFSGSEFNRATQANRQPGSAFKPFVYLAGLESGLTPISQLLDAPFVLEQAGGRKWRPANFSRKFYGLSPMYLGIEKSRNLMTVRLAQSLGMDKISEVAKRFQVQDNMPLQLSMALGAGETTLLRLTNAYGMLVNGGKAITPTVIDQIQDRHGKTIFRHDERICPNCIVPENAEAIVNNDALISGGIRLPVLADERKPLTSPQSAYQVVTMLERVVKYGTGRRIGELKLPLAGKTGTTNDSYDAWFVGFSPDLVVGIYTGFDDPGTLGRHPAGYEEGGSSVAAPIFKSVMQKVLADKASVPFRTPNGISFVLIDDETGRPATTASQHKTSIPFTSAYAARHFQGSEPTTENTLNPDGLY